MACHPAAIFPTVFPGLHIKYHSHLSVTSYPAFQKFDHMTIDLETPRLAKENMLSEHLHAITNGTSNDDNQHTPDDTFHSTGLHASTQTDPVLILLPDDPIYQRVLEAHRASNPSPSISSRVIHNNEVPLTTSPTISTNEPDYSTLDPSPDLPLAPPTSSPAPSPAITQPDADRTTKAKGNAGRRTKTTTPSANDNRSSSQKKVTAVSRKRLPSEINEEEENLDEISDDADDAATESEYESPVKKSNKRKRTIKERSASSSPAPAGGQTKAASTKKTGWLPKPRFPFHQTLTPIARSDDERQEVDGS